MEFITFLIASFFIIIMPGTGVLYTVSTGITQGKRESIYAAIGCTLGIVPHLLVSIVLSSILLQTAAPLFTAVQVVGCCYLIYLGIGMIVSSSRTEPPDAQDEGEDVPHGRCEIAVRGVLINLLNPKLALFFFSFLPQFVTPESDGAVVLWLLLGSAFMLVTFVVFVCYGLLAGAVRESLADSSRVIVWFLRVCGIIFIVFAAKLLWDQAVQLW